MEMLLSFKGQITEHLLWCFQGLFECEFQLDW